MGFLILIFKGLQEYDFHNHIAMVVKSSIKNQTLKI